jgi:L-lactate dehydrogenase complex protein LldG
MPVADQREAVFARIREALRVKAPQRHAAVVERHDDDLPPGAEEFRAWLPAVGPGREEQVDLFLRNSAALKTEVHRFATLRDAGAHLAAMAGENNWERIATHQHPLAFPIAETVPLPRMITDDGYTVADLESCSAAITGCDFLIAQTGSLLVSSGSAGGRALSVLPPHHVAVARVDQMVPDLATALRGAKERYAANWPSFLSFVTGPSRTGDIERILVLGAHGPKRLTVLLID